MYGDESAKPIGEDGSTLPAKTVVTAVVPVGRKRNSYGNSSYPQSFRSSKNDTGYNDMSSDSQPSSKYTSASEMLPALRSSILSDVSAHLPYLDDRPSSAYASSSVHRDSTHLSAENSRSSKFKDLPPRPNSAAIRAPSRSSTPDVLPRQPTPRLSRPPSTATQAAIGNADSSIPQHRSLRTPPPKARTPELLSPPRSSLYSPPRLPNSVAAPSSKLSLTPSEGEDGDAFHVRYTYAELEMTGVKGDGYEEGVERTRARASGSQASALREAAALDDGTEKTRDLTAKELQTLASLDRYGFFTIPSHDRLILLTSSPLSKRLSRVPSGPKTAPTAATSLLSLPAVSHPPKETSRIAKWGRMLEPRHRDEGGNIESWGIKASKESKLRERVYKGIPDRWRAAAWELLMSRFSGLSKQEMVALGAQYRETLDKPSTYDIQIDLDVPRTISGHIMFRTRYGSGQRSLFHVLHSFSLHCTDCGYVQGMGPIAATLLCYFEPERVYASLVRLHDAYAMHRIFSPGFPGLLEALYVQERITEQTMPEVYAAFKGQMISTTSYATKWYITLFANSVPFQTQLRLWDIFLLEGQDVFVAVAVAIVWVYRDNITSASANFETILSLLSSFFVPEDEDALLNWIEKLLADKKLRANMARWRQDWQGLVAAGKEGDALL
ncbi:hypothetical protein HWV62_10232 [Athelia sp. TMB]|nr:hypothetical protein HWV62_20890 [Athelia sp. TMB]KAF7975182.1 hypothetical protein HWV62_10232 [Athelia sp. TMB]